MCGSLVTLEGDGLYRPEGARIGRRTGSKESRPVLPVGNISLKQFQPFAAESSRESSVTSGDVSARSRQASNEPGLDRVLHSLP